MPIYQAFNKRTKAWVKYHFEKGKGFRVIDVKQREPLKPFKNVLKKGKRIEKMKELRRG